MTCKGICIRHKAQKPVGSGRYASGQKRCQICEIFIKWDGLWCPCCGYRLRTKPRNLKYKAKLRAKTVKAEAPVLTVSARKKLQALFRGPEQAFLQLLQLLDIARKIHGYLDELGIIAEKSAAPACKTL